MPRVFIGAGSNIDPYSNIKDALKLLMLKSEVMAVSTFYKNESIGRPGDPDYFNGVMLINTDSDPLGLKYDVLRDIEKSLGRVRHNDKYAPRTIDLDILVYDDINIHNKELDIPDRFILERPFLSICLFELDKSLFFQEWGKTVKDIAESFIDQKLKPLYDYTEMLRRILQNGY